MLMSKLQINLGRFFSFTFKIKFLVYVHQIIEEKKQQEFLMLLSFILYEFPPSFKRQAGQDEYNIQETPQCYKHQKVDRKICSM